RPDCAATEREACPSPDSRFAVPDLRSACLAFEVSPQKLTLTRIRKYRRGGAIQLSLNCPPASGSRPEYLVHSVARFRAVNEMVPSGSVPSGPSVLGIAKVIDASRSLMKSAGST